MNEFESLVIAANGGKVDGAQTRLADRIGVKQASVNRWCQKKSIPKPDVREKLAKTLGVTVEKLMSLFPSNQEHVEATNEILRRVVDLEKRMARLEKNQKISERDSKDFQPGEEGDTINPSEKHGAKHGRPSR